jgi:hypothetical protein
MIETNTTTNTTLINLNSLITATTTFATTTTDKLGNI